MLRAFGPSCSLEPVDAAAATSLPEGTLWADLVDPTREEEALVEAKLGQNIPTREELLEIEPSSRLYERQGTLFMTASVLHGLTRGKPDTDPVGFILGKDLLVTIRYVDPKPFIAFGQHLCAEPEIGPDPTEILLALLDSIVDRLADELEEAARDIETLAGHIFQQRSGRGRARRKAELRLEALLLRLGGAQRILAEIRESVVSTGRMLGFLAGKLPPRDSHKRHIESLQRDVAGLTDHDSFLSDNLTFLLNAALGLITLEQNTVMKIFSVFAVVLMPPTLIAGIYGMNFEHMPELEWLLGYPFALALILVSAVVPFWLARRSGWL